MNEQILEIISIAFSVFICVFLGIVFRRKLWVRPEADSTLSWLLINVFTPSLILSYILNNQALQRIENLFYSPIVGFMSILLGIVVCSIFAFCLRIGDRSETKTFVLCNSVYNYGYIPIPLVLYFFEKDTLGVLLLHNIGAEIALWTLGLLLLSQDSFLKNLKKLINAPFIAIVGGLLLNFLPYEQKLPSCIMRVLTILGQATIPTGLLLVGGIFAEHLEKVKEQKIWRVILGSISLRLMIIPSCFFLIACFLPCTRELKQVLVLQMGMPSGILPIILARQYGGNTSIAFKVVVSTSLVSLVTMPFWIFFASKHLL